MFLFKKLFDVCVRVSTIVHDISLKRAYTCAVSMCQVKGIPKSDVCRQRVYMLNVSDWLSLSLTASVHDSAKDQWG